MIDLEVFEARLGMFRGKFPALTGAVPPAQVERRLGICEFHVAAFFQDLAAARYRPASWLNDPAGLVGPIFSSGGCLEPVRSSSTADWVDPSLPADDGDFVLVQWHPKTLAGIIARSSKDSGWLARYGAQPPPLAIKLLKHFAGEQWLVTNESMMPLGRNRILGVVRHWQPTITQILMNAVCDPISTFVAGPINVVDNTSPFTFTTLATLSVPAYNVGTPTTQVLTLMADGDLMTSASTLTALQVAIFDETLAGPGNQQAILGNTLNQQFKGPIAREFSFSVPNNTPKTYTAQALVIGDGTGTVAGYVSNISFKCEVLLR